jgi:mannose-6-phosphate isomerase-like protein (cupin superfamily)
MPFIDPSMLPRAEPKPGWHGRFFHSEHMTFAYYDIEIGAALHVHSHPNEEVWNILEGEVDFTLGEETRRLGAGDAVVVPGGTTHAVAVRKACRAIIVDYPVRDEVGGVKI